MLWSGLRSNSPRWRSGLKLMAILAGSALVGFAMRRIVGLAAIERQNERIEGFNILVLFVFVTAVMESVAARFLAAPMITIGLAALAFVVFFAVLALTTLIFASAGRNRALTLGFMASQRNVGPMLAATGGTLPDLTWLYFAFCYFPLYLSPLLLQPATPSPMSSKALALSAPHQSLSECSPKRKSMGTKFWSASA
jgi:hypothetical protein